MRSWTVLCATVLLWLGAAHAAEALGAGEAVRLTASDGKTTAGTLYGKGEVGLVLCHGRAYKTGAESFASEAAWLAAKGIRCLALSFRGYPADDPPMLPGQELDIQAAVDHLVKAGAKRVYVLGSSMGGFAALKALKALNETPQFAGMIVISAFSQESIRGLGGRKLFVVAEDDARLCPNLLRSFLQADGPKHCIVFAKGGHGQQLFTTHRLELLTEILTFLTAREKPEE